MNQGITLRQALTHNWFESLEQTVEQSRNIERARGLEISQSSTIRSERPTHPVPRSRPLLTLTSESSDHASIRSHFGSSQLDSDPARSLLSRNQRDARSHNVRRHRRPRISTMTSTHGISTAAMEIDVDSTQSVANPTLRSIQEIHQQSPNLIQQMEEFTGNMLLDVNPSRRSQEIQLNAEGQQKPEKIFKSV